jgi:hypothetical protein
MGRYIILNFEDKITDKGVGASDSTVKGLTQRYEVRKAPKGISGAFMSKNTVTEHRCVDAGPPIGFSQDAARIATIKTACTGAEKIYLVMHGDPRTTDVCYTNAIPSTAGVLQLATASQMAAFLGKVLVGGKQELRLALVMCYGARCRNYQSAKVNHQGMIPQADLVTSFAYKLFYALHGKGIQSRLSAVTGKISHNSTTGGALIEVEELIDLNMELSEAKTAKLAAQRAAGIDPLKPLNERDATYKATAAAWSSSPGGAAVTQRFNTAQQALKAMEDKLPKDKGAYGAHKYGKIEYRLKGDKLTIATKYGDSTTGLKPGTVLYSGPLLQPG